MTENDRQAGGVERRCSTCDGTGSVESEKQVDAGEYVVESDLCPDCGGSGERPLQSPYGGGNDE